MTWTVVIPGTPPSVNHSYRPVTIKGSLRIAKSKEALAYQVLVSYLVKTSRPRGWSPPDGNFRILYDFYLKRSIDCDNAMKALNDAIASAIGVNDARFLPCVKSKSVSSKEANPRVEVVIGVPE